MAKPRPARPPPPFWLNISKTLSRSCRAMPGPSSATAISTSCGWPGARRAVTRITLSSGERRSAFSSTFARTWLIRTGSRWSGGRSAGASTVTRPGATIPPNWASASSTRSVKRTVVGRSSSEPASSRVMSRRLVTSRARRSDCSSMSSSSSARSSGLSWASTWRMLDTAVLMEASGVRRSCEAAPISARRQRSISSSRRARRACSLSCARSTASAAWLANVPSRLRSCSTSCTSWSTSMPTGRWLTTERDRHPPWAGVVEQSEGPRLAAARRDRGDVLVRQGLARAGGDPQGRTRAP